VVAPTSSGGIPVASERGRVRRRAIAERSLFLFFRRASGVGGDREPRPRCAGRIANLDRSLDAGPPSPQLPAVLTPAHAEDEAIIRASGLRKVYRGPRVRRRGAAPAAASDVTALDGLDLAIRAGEFFGLLGPNGAGKTTALGILTTRVRATAGRAT